MSTPSPTLATRRLVEDAANALRAHQTARHRTPRRRLSAALAAAGAAATLSAGAPAHAVGSLVDVTIVERDGVGALANPTYPHQGRWYVAGRPGARYAIRISNRSGERVLAVMSVDGVNIVSGRTASFEQGGYVLGPWESYEITGWRKSPSEVAAFYFTSLPDSYAARTGRPDEVGVIGVALFKERVVRPYSQIAPPVSPAAAPRADAGAADGDRRARAEGADVGRASAGSAAAPAAAGATASPVPPAAQERLGTGHGEREASYSRQTTFERSSRQPVEVVSLFYDSLENLARAGVIAAPAPVAQRRPNAFPSSYGFVPDPPRY